MLHDRTDAGLKLAALLADLAGRDDVYVLGLPRGGVPVAYEVAMRLDAPLDIFLVRKLGVPGREELAFGAIASGGVLVLNEDVVDALRVPPQVIDQVQARETEELRRRETLYRGNRPPPQLSGKTAILIDDGLATGASMQSAVEGLRKLVPAAIVVAVPVAPPGTIAEFSRRVDRVECIFAPEPFYGVGYWYDDFRQVDDDEVRDLLRAAENRANHSVRLGKGAE
jgi:predicted phosphoribosyltransferase